MSNIMQREPKYTEIPVLPHPSLIMDEEDIEALRAKRSDLLAEELFQAALSHVEDRMDPESEDYVDYETLSDPVWRTRKGLGKVRTVEPLAFFHALTGERRYAEFAKGIVFAVIRNKLADRQSTHYFDSMKEEVAYPGWRRSATHDFGGFALTLALFYDLCYDLLSAEERSEFVTYAEECLAIRHEMRSEAGRMSMNNRGARCSMGNGLLALAIAGDHTDQKLVDDTVSYAIYDAEAFAHFTFGIDGAPYEGGSYAGNGSTMLALFGRALARRGCRDFGHHWNVSRYPAYLLYTLVPGNQELILLNDCSGDCPVYPLLAATAQTEDPVARWLWDELRTKLKDDGYGSPLASHHNFFFYDPAVQPVSPDEAGYPLAKHFRDRGVVSALTGWGADDARATFFCGPQQFVCHRQEDQNTFTLCALGEKFAWDAGYGHYGLGVGRRYRDTNVHNGILIDGQGQNSYGELRWSRGQMVASQNTEEWTYALGDASRCYGLNGSIERADRHFFFKRRPHTYLLVVDDLIADQDEHDLTWNFVTHPGNLIEQREDGSFTVRGAKAAMDLLMSASQEFHTVQDTAGEMPRLQLTQRACRAHFAALLVPRGPGVEDVELAASFGPNSAEVSVAIDGAEETVTFDLRDRTGIRVGDERVEVSFSS